MAALTALATSAARLAASQPADQFLPVKSLPPPEQLPAAPLVVAAYAFLWAVLLVYVWTIWRRLVKVEREIRQLSSRMDAGAGTQ